MRDPNTHTHIRPTAARALRNEVCVDAPPGENWRVGRGEVDVLERREVEHLAFRTMWRSSPADPLGVQAFVPQ